MSIRAGVDTGGTFTDLVLYDEEQRRHPHVQGVQTPSQPSRAVFDSFAKAGFVDNGHLVLRARHDRRDQRPDRAPRRRRRAADHGRLPRHPAHPARDAPEPLRPALGQAAALRAPRALRRRPGARAARRVGARCRWTRTACAARSSGCATSATSTRSASRYLFSFVNPDHELRTRELIARALAGGAGLAVARGAAALARVRAHLDDGARRLSQAADARATWRGWSRSATRAASTSCSSCAPTAAS